MLQMISCSNGGGYFLSPMLLPQGVQPVTMASWAPSITMGMTGVNMGISSPTMTSISGRQYRQLQPISSVHTTQTNNTGTIPPAKFNVTAQETLKPAAVSPVYQVIIPAATHGSVPACNPVPMQRLQKPVQVLLYSPLKIRSSGSKIRFLIIQKLCNMYMDLSLL